MAGTGERPELTGFKVLLVDDHRDSADSMAWLLRSFGCRAEARFDAATALECVEAFAPDAVILDIRLPDLPGTEVCRRLRSIESLSRTAVIALTGATDDSTLASIREAGFHQTLIKPVELHAILDALGEAAASR